MLQIKNNGSIVTPKVTNVSDGQILEFDYKPVKADQIIQLVHEDILDGSAYGYMGDYYFKQTMLWTGDSTMPYEKNTSEASRLKSIFDNLNNISLAMKDPGKAYGSFNINANGILTEFLNADGSLKTSTLTTAGKIINLIQGETNTAIQQMTKDIYNVTVAKEDIINEINVQAGSTIFSAKDSTGKNILQITPQTTYIQNATITNAMIKDLSASKLTAGTINASLINVINVNLKNLVGDYAEFIRMTFNGKNSLLHLTGDYVNILNKNGYSAVKFHSFGMQVFRDGISAGWFQAYHTGVGIIADEGKDLALGIRDDNRSTGFTASLIVRRNTGLVHIAGGIETPMINNIRFSLYASGGVGMYMRKGHSIVFEPNGSINFLVNNASNWLHDILYKLNYLWKNRSSGETVTPPSYTTPENVYYYAIKGDYPYLIAEKNGITMNELFRLNAWYSRGQVVVVGSKWRVE